MKKINLLLRKCKTLSTQLGRTSSYSGLRSKSTRDDHFWGVNDHHDMMKMDGTDHYETILVGSSRRRYVISSKYLNHPLLNALIEKSKRSPGEDIVVRCEVVLFDHLLWMMENADSSDDSLEELADLYVL